jgi:hypothetical protein
MKLMAHLLRADARRVAALLIIWLATVAAVTTLDLISPTLASLRLQEVLSIVQSLLGITKSLLLILLVVMTVQLHPLVGTDAFWMTRPVPPLVLLGAKTVFLWSSIVLVLVAAQAILMAMYGVSARTLTAISLDTALGETFWLLLVMTGAAITLNLARFAMLCAGLFAAVGLMISIAFAIAMARIRLDGPSAATGVADVDGTKALITSVLAICAVIGLLVIQYRTRSRFRSVPAGALGLALALTAGSLWNVPLLARPRPQPAWTQDEASARLVPDWSTLKLTAQAPFFNEERPWHMLRARVGVESLPPFWSARAFLLSGSVQLTDGTTWTSPRSGSTMLIGASAESGPYGLLADLLGVRRLFGTADWPADDCTLLVVPHEAVEFAHSALEGRYEGTFSVQLTRYEIEGTLPLERARTHQAGDHRVSIQRISQSGSSAAVFVSESRAASPFGGARPIEVSFYLRNRALGEAVTGMPQEIFSDGVLLGGLLPGWSRVSQSTTGFSARARMVRFPAVSREGADPSPIDHAWLSNAELVIVRSAVEASVQRTLRTDKFLALASR